MHVDDGNFPEFVKEQAKSDGFVLCEAREDLCQNCSKRSRFQSGQLGLDETTW